MSIWNKAQSLLGNELERALLARVAGWPSHWVHCLLVVLFSIWVLVDVLFLGITGGVAQSTYDAMTRWRLFAPAHDSRIVIIDIDEAALSRMSQEFGRWPWPRDTLATVLDFVESQKPAAVVWDIVFSDSDRLSPGGDAAFDDAVKRSAHSHFGVVRLPRENDTKSQLSQKNLPTLWATTSPITDLPAANVALIPPALPGVAASTLGYNNGYVDRDGVLRRYRYFERLTDGSIIQSLPISVVRDVNPEAHAFWLNQFKRQDAKADTNHATADDVLISWRKQANSYPRINFADVFAIADGGEAKGNVPSLAGKIVIIGSTAPSLHDIHPTPLSATQAGVESLATGIDNALHERNMRELPQWARALLAIVMCAVVAAWSYQRGIASLGPAMLVLPSLLFCVSFASLHTESVFLDLHLSAGLVLVFLAVLRIWYTLQKRFWCGDLPVHINELAVWAWKANKPWTEDALFRLMSGLQKHAGNSKIILFDTDSSDSQAMRWRPYVTYLAVVGPLQELQSAKAQLSQVMNVISALQIQLDELQAIESYEGQSEIKQAVASAALKGWLRLQDESKINESKHL